ncbi:MAG TPA: hypothetical protein VKU40_05760 [Thermoanaerobaculia bacterium]|nr:hypothetical protein [Thermoanaerobaculia bacterium]
MSAEREEPPSTVRPADESPPESRSNPDGGGSASTAEESPPESKTNPDGGGS